MLCQPDKRIWRVGFGSRSATPVPTFCVSDYDPVCFTRESKRGLDEDTPQVFRHRPLGVAPLAEIPKYQPSNPVLFPARKSHMPGMPTINKIVGVGVGVAIEVGVGVRSTTTRFYHSSTTLSSRSAVLQLLYHSRGQVSAGSTITRGVAAGSTATSAAAIPAIPASTSY